VHHVAAALTKTAWVATSQSCCTFPWRAQQAVAHSQPRYCRKGSSSIRQAQRVSMTRLSPASRRGSTAGHRPELGRSGIRTGVLDGYGELEVREAWRCLRAGGCGRLEMRRVAVSFSGCSGGRSPISRSPHVWSVRRSLVEKVPALPVLSFPQVTIHNHQEVLLHSPRGALNRDGGLPGAPERVRGPVRTRGAAPGAHKAPGASGEVRCWPMLWTSGSCLCCLQESDGVSRRAGLLHLHQLQSTVKLCRW